MVVVQVRYRGETSWRRLVFAESFSIGSGFMCALRLANAKPLHAQIVIDGPDVRLELEPGCAARLDQLPVDRTFLHVLHVGNVLEIHGSYIAFELVDGLQADIDRYLSGRGKHVLDETEMEFIDALRANPDDAETLDVYADWLDEHERPLLAEQIRLQRLRDTPNTPTSPSAFQSKWLSAEPAAVALRLRDLSPFAEPWWRALVGRCVVLGCAKRYADCPRWHGLTPTDAADRRTCKLCDRDVHFCWSRDDIRGRGRTRDLVAIDPGLAIHDPESAYLFPERDPSEEITGEHNVFGDEVT